MGKEVYRDRFALIGNAPSSGSSLLADLLDSTPASSCGPETNLFANRNLYQNYRQFSLDPRTRGQTSCIYTKYVRTYFKGVAYYGLDEMALGEALRGCANANEFIHSFRGIAVRARALPEDAIVFDKTPQNICCIGEFLDTSPNGYFLTIVRDPMHVFQSLRRREFSPMRAAGAWLFDIAHYLPYRDHPRVIEIRYEELVEDPYGQVSDIMTKLFGVSFPREELSAIHKNNSKRQKRGAGIDSWQFRDTKTIGSGNQRIEKQFARELAAWLDVRIAPFYADLFNSRAMTLREGLVEFCYEDTLARLHELDVEPFRPSLEDKSFLFDKYSQSVSGREIGSRHRELLEQPVVPPVLPIKQMPAHW